MPSSSSGLGHSPLKAETGVRFPVGAPAIPLVRKIDWVNIPHPGNPGIRKLFPSMRDLIIYALRQDGKSVSELVCIFIMELSTQP